MSGRGRGWYYKQKYGGGGRGGGGGGGGRGEGRHQPDGSTALAEGNEQGHSHGQFHTTSSCRMPPVNTMIFSIARCRR